ncbi:MAG: biotin synthase BioB [Deltaproteobacteria bacterium]|nr:biotin synthase BioB [Deltaproteobacteria bacterium]
MIGPVAAGLPRLEELVAESLDRGIGLDTARALVALPPEELPLLLAAADRVRRTAFGDRIRLCAIVNARSNLCGEDCAFCAQSRRSRADIPSYPLLDGDTLRDRAAAARAAGAVEFSVVTSGRRPGPAELDRLAVVLAEDTGMERCVSVGILGREELRRLRDAGLRVFHHNLEASPRFYGTIVSTRTFQENLDAVRAAKEAGLQVCSGGIFGMGETWEDRLELFRILRELAVDRVPLNFLNPIPGTPLGDRPLLDAREALCIIAIARLMLPRRHINVAGGREVVLGDLQAMVFLAGATGILLGDYLTTRGRAPADDLEMIRRLGLRVDDAPLAGAGS